MSKSDITGSIILAIDPAKAAGWALFVDRKLVCYGAADGSMWHTLIAAMKGVTGWLIGRDSTACVIEDGFYSGPRNFRGVLTLGRRRGLAQAAAEFYGFRKFEFIGPQNRDGQVGWQTGLGYVRGGDSKAFSLGFAKAHYGLEHISHDVADAICIGHYYLTTLPK